MASGWQPKGRLGRVVNEIEETAIAVILGLMTLITFVNVVFRKLSGWTWLREREAAWGIDIPDSLIWGQEAVLILFAWLVMFGVSYAVKVTAHLGVDALVNILPPKVRRAVALVAVTACVIFALLLFKGGWDAFANFANLPKTTGRIIPTGFEEMRLQDFKGYRPTVQIPFPEWARGPIEGWLLLDGDPPFEKLPIVFPYLIYPIGTGLLLYRYLQAAVGILRGERDGLIVSHEAEDAIADLEKARDPLAKES